MKNIVRLELEEARLMVNAAVAKSKEIGVLESICVVDEGGFPIVLERMNGARITGPQIAWNKAFTAAGHKRSTHLFNTPPNGPALPGNEAFGIQFSFEGKFAVNVAQYLAGTDWDWEIRVVDGSVTSSLWSTWIGPFPLAIGLLALTVCAYLAAVYLCVETSGELQEDFRRRALIRRRVWRVTGETDRR